jgi:hypothetical protein
MNSRLFTIIALLLCVVLGNRAEAQEKISVSGIVTSFKQIPLNKVKIVALKSGEVSFTDSIGRFSIKGFEKDVLTFSAGGFESKNVRIGKQNTIIVNLLYKDNIGNFNNVVNGRHLSEETLKKAINNELLKSQKDYSKYNSIYQLVQSEVYDVRVSGTSVYNRKIRSMNLNPQVLYVVDDKIVPDISYINPTYVKSIEFIDDVGSTMYGSMGANGVLKIALKN